MFGKKVKTENGLYGIIGLGRFGYALAQTLSESGKDLIIIDENEAKINSAAAFTDHAYVVQELSKENFRKVGIDNCDVVIICIGERIDTCILATECYSVGCEAGYCKSNQCRTRLCAGTVGGRSRLSGTGYGDSSGKSVACTGLSGLYHAERRSGLDGIERDTENCRENRAGNQSSKDVRHQPDCSQA
mgnify:CR=1 FL=1